MTNSSNNNNSKNILCISSVDWFPIPTRKQQVMARLPGDYRVLYIEPPITLLSPVKDRRLFFKLTAFLTGLREVEENVLAYSPPPVLPFGNVYRWINRINQWWQSLFIKNQVKKAGLKNPAAWTYMPNSLDLIKKIEHSFLIYDCIDEHAEYKGFINKDTLLEMEKELVKESNLVFVTAPGLYKTRKEMNPNTFLIPNGVNFQLFNQAASPEMPAAEEIKDIKKPVIGFVGVIQEWIDLELIYKIAGENPGWSVVMVGPVGAGVNVEKLKSLPNVYFTGAKKPEELPQYIRAFDVCINPFRPSKLTENVSPLKFYEYLATGKPVVTVDMPAVKQYKDCVYIASHHRDFVEKIKLALSAQESASREKRISEGKKCSWENRVAQMLEIKEKMLGDISP